MPNFLDEIVAKKKEELQQIQKPVRLRDVLRKGQLSVIAEIKRKSPSVGEIREIADPIQLAKEYIAGGASAISVLTDNTFFNGSTDDLQKIRKAFPRVPILRKDFIVDLEQINETYRMGASAVLLIVAVLGKELPFFIKRAQDLGLDPIIEIHHTNELDIALESGAEIIGVNTRDLKTFNIDDNVAINLIQAIPKHVITVAESGIKDAKTAHKLRKAGYDAILVGEALVRSDNRAQLIKEMIR